jgi:hypothetical protein
MTVRDGVNRFSRRLPLFLKFPGKSGNIRIINNGACVRNGRAMRLSFEIAKLSHAPSVHAVFFPDAVCSCAIAVRTAH